MDLRIPSHALADSLANLTRSSVAMLDVLEDVDDAQSLMRQSLRGLLYTLLALSQCQSGRERRIMIKE